MREDKARVMIMHHLALGTTAFSIKRSLLHLDFSHRTVLSPSTKSTAFFAGMYTICTIGNDAEV